jgi:hypothetical protein
LMWVWDIPVLNSRALMGPAWAGPLAQDSTTDSLSASWGPLAPCAVATAEGEEWADARVQAHMQARASAGTCSAHAGTCGGAGARRAGGLACSRHCTAELAAPAPSGLTSMALGCMHAWGRRWGSHAPPQLGHLQQRGRQRRTQVSTKLMTQTNATWQLGTGEREASATALLSSGLSRWLSR